MEDIYNMTDGGEIRAARGALVETLVRECVEAVGLVAKKGTSDKQTIRVGQHSKEHQVDVHVYKETTPVVFVECKAYLDSCYLARAVDDFRLLHIAYPNMPCIVVALENSVAEDAVVFSEAANPSQCTRIFYLLEGKRSSSRPVYKREFSKSINPLKLRELLEFLQSLSVPA
jgi:hypothetical protein